MILVRVMRSKHWSDVNRFIGFRAWALETPFLRARVSLLASALMPFRAHDLPSICLSFCLYVYPFLSRFSYSLSVSLSLHTDGRRYNTNKSFRILSEKIQASLVSKKKHSPYLSLRVVDSF